MSDFVTDLDKLELSMKIGDAAARLIDIQDRQTDAINALLDSIDEYARFLEKSARGLQNAPNDKLNKELRDE